MAEKEIKCAECGRIFILRTEECEALRQTGRREPHCCPACRQRHRKEKESELQKHEAVKQAEKRKQDHIRYVEALNTWSVVPLSEVKIHVTDKSLCVIGNGFDMMHRVKSSYYDFGKTIGRRSNLRFYLEHYLRADDLWADLEGALAKIDVEAMCMPHIIDMALDIMGAYDKDAGLAEFYCAAEMAASPATALADNLKRRFREWVDTLDTNTNGRPLQGLFNGCKVLNFNYTEFVESLYGVNSDSICYIHGCRKKKKGCPREELILGHMSGASDAAYAFENRYEGIDLSGNRAQKIYDAQQAALDFVSWADQRITKNCDVIIAQHRSFFNSLTETDCVVTVGHSLYPVDWDYFRELIAVNRDKESIQWFLGCHGYRGLAQIEKFVEEMGIKRENVRIFRTDIITTLPLHVEDNLSSKNSLSVRKIIGESDDKRWAVFYEDNAVTIVDTSDRENTTTRLFSTYINGAIFDASATYLLLVARGTSKGVFLFWRTENSWSYIRELEGIPNQGVITKRLCKVVLARDEFIFLYKNSVRKYSTDNGALTYNRGEQHAFERDYQGENLTPKFERIYAGGFR